MGRCVFCDRSPVPTFALTIQNGDPHKTSSWRREVLPVCPRCHRALADVGLEMVLAMQRLDYPETQRLTEEQKRTLLEYERGESTNREGSR